MNYTPSPHCKGKPHRRHTVFPRSDQPNSNIGECIVCHEKHEYPMFIDPSFHGSLESNPLISHWAGYDR